MSWLGVFTMFVACVGLVKTLHLKMHVMAGINLATILLLLAAFQQGAPS